MLPDFIRRQRDKIVNLAARANRKQQFVHIHGNEDEKRIRWGFFQPLQKSIGCLCVQQFGWIDDEDFIATFKRLKLEHVKKMTNLGDFDVRGLVFD